MISFRVLHGCFVLFFIDCAGEHDGEGAAFSGCTVHFYAAAMTFDHHFDERKAESDAVLSLIGGTQERGEDQVQFFLWNAATLVVYGAENAGAARVVRGFCMTMDGAACITEFDRVGDQVADSADHECAINVEPQTLFYV